MNDLRDPPVSAHPDQRNAPEPTSELRFFALLGSIVLAEVAAVVAWIAW